MNQTTDNGRRHESALQAIIRYCVDNKLIVTLVTLALVTWGILVAPFDWELAGLPRDPTPVDAIPDIGENQQIVFTQWMGRSPQDIEDQVTYPLTVSLLGIPGVKNIRSYSYFGFSTIYVIFDDDVEFYWSRSRLLEKLSSLPAGSLPAGVTPALGPDATALGQVFWYTLEGRDEDGQVTGGWDLHELRSIQDWTVRYALQSAAGVAEVASIGGYVREYQVDVNPDALRTHNITLEQVFSAVRSSNIDVGARTTEINRVEYVIRGLGFVKSLEDLERTVVAERNGAPLYIRDVATVGLGPAQRRGALDKGGAEVVGGVVVTRFGDNPLQVINNVKDVIAEISPGLPKKTLADGRTSQVTVVPFYDRSGLIYETLNTLNRALVDEILITIIVVVIMVMSVRSSLLITGLLPLTVLLVFIAMKTFGVDANIVALSGIAIAIGAIVDMGIVVTENILRHLDNAPPGVRLRDTIVGASVEVGGAVLTAVSTTVVSFLPVFTMEAAEGKLFKPLAYTKTFALVASILIALLLIPPLAHTLFSQGKRLAKLKHTLPLGLALAGIGALALSLWWTGVGLFTAAAYLQFKSRIPQPVAAELPKYFNYLVVAVVAWILAEHWLPLGAHRGVALNFVFVAALVGALLYGFALLIRWYEPMLRWCLAHKKLFLSASGALLAAGLVIWLGVDRLLGFLPDSVRATRPYVALSHAAPGMGKEFMPPLDEGSFLWMPTTMPHASIGEALDVLHTQDKAFSAIPELATVVGKLGRADSPLDPAPISMIETVINYKPEYILDERGRRKTFAYDSEREEFMRDRFGELVEDPNGRPYRQWREHIKRPDDIWEEVRRAGKLTGSTSAPRLQPIAARIVMLQSGMRAPMGIKVKGPNLESIEEAGLALERALKSAPGVEAATVIADRVVGKPYLEIDINREEIARFGLSIQRVQSVIEVAIGGKWLSTTVEGRERYPMRVRYQRELRNSLESIGDVLVSTPAGAQIPLKQVAEIRFVRGPMVIKSEDTFLIGYVIFDKLPDWAEVDVVNAAQEYLAERRAAGALTLPEGVSYTFAGSYENQVRSEKRLTIILPLALLIIFLILYFQFKRVSITLLVFSGVFVAWAGGFLALWLYGQDWFLNFSLLGVDFRELFQIQQLNLSVAVWVGFLALFGIASDNGVLICTYLNQVFDSDRPATSAAVREATVKASLRRIRPALMTSATTMLALIPVLTSSGRGSDIMIPMAIPSFGGMAVALVTVFLVPVLYCALAERRLKTVAGEVTN